MDYVTLNDGVKIPQFGFGVYLIPNDGSTYKAVLEALKIGYRHIDTAMAYFNEEEVGRAVKDSGIPREDIFITSKLWIDHYEYEDAKRGIDRSLRLMGLEYMDLYLLHHPYCNVPAAWKALEEGQKEGKIRSIGVSNMTPKIWNNYVPDFHVKPSVNQVECNPFWQQKELRKIMAETDTKLECWGPLGQGNQDLLNHPLIGELAEKYEKDAGQIILRFEIQEGFIVFPKSVNPKRIRSNMDIFDFSLSDDDMNRMRGLDQGKGIHDPDRDGVKEMLLEGYRIED